MSDIKSKHYIQYLSGIITEEQFYEIEEQQLDEISNAAKAAGLMGAAVAGGIGSQAFLQPASRFSPLNPEYERSKITQMRRQFAPSEYTNPIIAEELPRLEKRIQMTPIKGTSRLGKPVKILQITPDGQNSSGEVSVVVRALCPPSEAYKNTGILPKVGKFGRLKDDASKGLGAAESVNLVHDTLNKFLDDANYRLRVESDRTNHTEILKVNPDGSYEVEVHTYILPPRNKAI